MATADRPPAGLPAAVAEGLADFFAATRAGPVAATAAAPGRELAESLAVCQLDPRHVAKTPADPTVIAEPSGFWHHQIRTGGVPTHTARSLQSGLADGAEVQEVAESPLAERIDAAMAWVDRRIPGRATVRLLDCPAYFLTALLVVRDADLSVVVADRPDGFARIEYETEYPLADFLALLRRQKPTGNFAR